MTDLDYNIAYTEKEIEDKARLLREYTAKATKYEMLTQIIKGDLDNKHRELADLQAQKERRDEERRHQCD
mgnify:CR=1 FL=1